jgi:hypothetical protein
MYYIPWAARWKKYCTTPGLALTTADPDDPDEEHSSRSASINLQLHQNAQGDN